MARAMSELLAERAFHDITVQDILDRAGVARGTFYRHFRNKDDVLFSSYESMFAWLEGELRKPWPHGTRLAPVTEFLLHVDSARPVLVSLHESSKLEEIWELGVAYLADMIERRLDAYERPIDARLPSGLVARMLGGALVEMTKWWLEHPGRVSAHAMDAEFHHMARRTLPPFSNWH
jgi:AcrR family transcriptional regulator